MMALRTRVTERKNIVSGLWKFNLFTVLDVPEGKDLQQAMEEESVTIILGVAEEILLEEPDNYLRMYVCKCSTSQLGIGFEYTLEGPDFEKSRKKFFYKMTDLFKRRFGSNFAGCWDIASPTWLIEMKDPS